MRLRWGPRGVCIGTRLHRLRRARDRQRSNVPRCQGRQLLLWMPVLRLLHVLRVLRALRALRGLKRLCAWRRGWRTVLRLVRRTRLQRTLRRVLLRLEQCRAAIADVGHARVRAMGRKARVGARERASAVELDGAPGARAFPLQARRGLLLLLCRLLVMRRGSWGG